MPYIRKVKTIDDIKRYVSAYAEVSGDIAQAYFSVNTCWWTHRSSDLHRHRESGLPCDPRGGMLMQSSLGAFVEAAEDNPDNYGRHGLDAFIAAHNDNCVVSEINPRSACLRAWQDYNNLLDAQYLAERD